MTVDMLPGQSSRRVPLDNGHLYSDEDWRFAFIADPDRFYDGLTRVYYIPQKEKGIELTEECFLEIDVQAFLIGCCRVLNA